MSIIRTRILQIAALSILASCGEQKATVGGDHADSVPETSANTSDSIGKRLGIKMPATAVDFTQIPARDPDRAEVFTMSASRDGNSVALRTPNTILLLNGAFQTEKEIPADFLINSTSDYYLRYGLNFVFDIQSVLADTSGNLKYLLNAYRITKGHANFGQRESRAILDLPNGEILYDVDSLGDQIVGVTRNAVASPVRIYAFNSAGLRVQSLDITSMTSGTFVNNVVAIGGTAAGGTNSAKINEYWVYGPDNVQPQTTVYRIAAEGKDAGKLMGKWTMPGIFVERLTLNRDAAGQLKIYAHAGQFAADGAYPAQLSAYEIPYSASVASSEAGLPIADSTKVTSIPNFERHFERQTLTILGGAFFKLQPGTKPWQLPGRRSSTIDVVNQSSGSTVRTFSFSSIMCCNFILPLSAGTNIDVATFQLVHNPGGDLNEDPPLMFRTRGDQTVPVTGLSSDAMTFLSSWTSGLQSAVIPGEFTNGSRKILFFSGNAQSTESPAFGIVTLQSSGASAEFAGPFPVSGLPTHTVFPGLAVSRNGGQIVAYLGTIIPGVVANRSTVTIRSINLTAAAATAPGSTLDSPLTTSVVFDAKDIPYASYVDSIRVQGNFLYGFILDSAPDDSGHKASTLIKSDLNAPGAKATLMPLTKSVIDALDLTGTVFGFQIATEPDKQGNQVPYVFNTLADGSIVEIRKDAKTNALSDLTYWLRPEGGILKFGPVSIFFEWFLAGDTFIGSPAPGQLVLATKDQIRKSYVQSKTLPSEFAGAKQYRIAYLNRGNFLTAVISGDRIGLDPRSVKSGATTVSCPGFEAKVSPDGNFVVEKVTKTSAGKQNVSRQIVWRATTTPVKGSFLDFNAQNGRIALLDPYWRVIWDSGTGGKGAAKLVMQSDGNLVALDATKKALWDSRGCLLGKCTNTNKLVPAACEK